MATVHEVGAVPPTQQAGHPLGPLVERVHPQRLARTRWIAATCLAACAGLLGVAGWLSPSPAGLGTHRQLGLPPCGFLIMTGLPCPTCGMTTAYAHAVRGQWRQSAAAQPMGLVLALTTGGGAALSLVALLTGTVWTLNWYRVRPERVVFVVTAMLLAGWAVRIAVHLRVTAPLG